MARYRVAHYPSRGTWIHENDDGTFRWDQGYDGAKLFPNYKAAKAALDSLPDEKLMYGVSYKTKCTFMKFYDSEEHMKIEQQFKQDMRTLRAWGEI